MRAVRVPHSTRLVRKSLSPAPASKKSDVDLGRTVIRAPIDGVIARLEVQLGQRVQPSMPLLSVVPVDKLYVNANFKEVQLTEVDGQSVELKSDLYHSKVGITGSSKGLMAVPVPLLP